MLTIVNRFSKSTWQLGQALKANLNSIKEIHADGGELEYLRARIMEVPMDGKSSWVGHTAQFIIESLQVSLRYSNGKI